MAPLHFASFRGAEGLRGEVPKGTPGKAVRPTGRTCSTARGGHLGGWVGRFGRPQSPTKGKLDGTLPPNGPVGSSEHLGPRGRWWPPTSVGGEPEVSRTL